MQIGGARRFFFSHVFSLIEPRPRYLPGQFATPATSFNNFHASFDPEVNENKAEELLDKVTDFRVGIPIIRWRTNFPDRSERGDFFGDFITQTTGAQWGERLLGKRTSSRECDRVTFAGW